MQYFESKNTHSPASKQVYIAHRTDDGREQTIREHSCAVGELACGFADAFGAGKLARTVGNSHDVGKYSDAFQRRINGANIQTDHSTAGGQLLYSKNQNTLGMIAAYCVMGHHGGLPNGGSECDGNDEPTLHGRLKRQIEDYSAFSAELQKGELAPPSMKISDIFGAHFFTRFLFSSLVDADYLDTERFFDEKTSAVRSGFLPEEKSAIEELYARLCKYIERFLNPQEHVSEINARRTLLLKNCLSAAEEKPGLFTLTAPTGSGKTISSLSFALAHALKNGLRRIIYVVPYNTIIEQNAKVFEDILGVENVLQHHSNINYDRDDDCDENERKRFATENWDYPLIVTSSVQFFESIFGAKPSKCRKLHNIAGSVLIFDEAQMIPQPYLRPCVRAIRELVANYNCSAVLATATQSVLDEFFNPMPLKEIVENPSNMYEFFRRTKIKQLEASLTRDELVSRLEKHEQALCIVNTRKQAQMIFSALKSEGVFHLSTTMYPKHRSRVLKEIRDRLKNGLTCRVVSTSLVEAGVDLDFPVVYREKSGLDSIVQAAGRCNREGERSLNESYVYVFSLLEHLPPKSMQAPIGAFEQIADLFAEDLSSLDAVRSYFEQLFYNKGEDALDAKGILNSIQHGNSSFSIPFRDIADKLRMIEDDTTTVLVLSGAPELETRLRRNGERSRALFRETAQYGVSLRKYEIKTLETIGAIEKLDDAVFLLNPIYYNENYGVELSPEGGQAIFA